jgi:hypothetical protein
VLGQRAGGEPLVWGRGQHKSVGSEQKAEGSRQKAEGRKHYPTSTESTPTLMPATTVDSKANDEPGLNKAFVITTRLRRVGDQINVP